MCLYVIWKLNQYLIYSVHYYIEDVLVCTQVTYDDVAFLGLICGPVSWVGTDIVPLSYDGRIEIGSADYDCDVINLTR